MTLIDENTRVVVQGITGHQGRFHTKAMIEYGTNVVAGVTPKKGGEKVEGIQVYDSLSDVDADASIIFVPAPYAKSAIMEAINAKLNPIIPITEHIPVHDSMYCISQAKKEGIDIIGPNTAGLIAVGKSKMGIMPNHIFTQGKVAVIARSGTLTYEIVSQMSKAGIGQSTVIGLGGDPVTGVDYIRALELFERDKETSAIVLIGEIGGDAEENAAEYIKKNLSKPVVAYVAGRTAPKEKTMGHAGAIITGDKGTYESKKNAFEASDIGFAKLPNQINNLLKARL